MKKKVFGVLLLMEAMFLAISTIVSLCYGEQDLFALLIPTCLTAACGGVLFMADRKNKGSLTRKDCYMIISGAWVIFSLLSHILANRENSENPEEGNPQDQRKQGFWIMA